MTRVPMWPVALSALVWGIGAGAQAPAGAPVAGPRIDLAAFAHQRRIPAGARGLSTLRLDVAALAHSRLSDIRLVSSAGRQVPYLLDPDPEPLRITLPPLVPAPHDDVAERVSQLRGRNRSAYRLPLPAEPLPACRLVLVTPARVFERGVTVLSREPARRGDRDRWQTRAWEVWRHADPGQGAPPLVLDLPAVAAADARLIVDEGDNPPLPIEAPTIELNTWRLRFVRETGDALWLAYGRPDLAAPRYDLALLDSLLKAEPAVEVQAEAERPPVREGARSSATVLFWAALVAAVIALLALLVRLLTQV